MEKREPSYTLGGNADWYKKKVWGFLKNLKIELPYDSAIFLMSVYPKEIKSLSGRGICPPLFITALFTLSVHKQVNQLRKCGVYIMK